GRRLAVGRDAVIGQDQTRHVVLAVEVAAGAADTAIDEAADADAVADLEFRDLRADRRDDAGDLMTGDDRIDGILPFVADGVDVRVADAGELDFDDDVVVVRLAAL